MDTFTLIIGLLIAGAVLSSLARRLRAPHPALLALAGTLGACIPGLPEVTLDPELALALFVAPALVEAGFRTSLRDLRENWRPVGGLAVLAVLGTVAAVACLAQLLIPAMPWAAAIALGAIVAPPDAAAATAVLRHLKPPHRLLVILEGESLLNDAAALLVYRITVGAAAAGSFAGIHVLPMLLLTCGGGALLGAGFAWTLARFVRLEEAAAGILVQFLATFVLWILAEALHVSPVIAMVACALVAGRMAPGRTSTARRLASALVWSVALFVLELLAFILIGLQLRGILDRMAADAPAQVGFAAAIAAAVILVRLAGVTGWNALERRLSRPRPGLPARLGVPDAGSAVLVGWCGMRGIVTLATALALPAGFPFRDLILLTAFAVVLATLVLQGLSLGGLMRRLDLPRDDGLEEETLLARRDTAAAALAALEAAPAAAAAPLRPTYAARAAGLAAVPDPAPAALHARAIAAQRDRLAALRRSHRIGDVAFRALQAEIDALEHAGPG